MGVIALQHQKKLVDARYCQCRIPLRHFTQESNCWVPRFASPWRRVVCTPAVGIAILRTRDWTLGCDGTLKLSCCELLVVSILFSLQFVGLALCAACSVLFLSLFLVGLGFVFWIAVEVP